MAVSAHNSKRERAEQLIAQGLETRVIAERLGVSRGAVRGYADRMKKKAGQ